MKKFKITFNSPVTLGFIFVCFAVLVLGFLTGGLSNQLLFMSYHSSLLDPLTYVRFFTHVLGHSGWDHYIGNSAYILLLGPMLEEKYGSKRLLQIILITALVTGIVNYVLFWNVALCGASGVVFAFILLTSFTSFKEGEIPLTFILVAIIFLGQQIYDGLFVQDDISNLSHIIGGIIGAVVGYRLNRK
ncbi:rhomboid family intramembrane serine protease [Butyrivibrio sp. CB08]|uniref:rhomboid family intramembrane serine protease n=1 Tax=Butyrivibrio sp. CB08 TaxID=2364879 RepID=UPI000EA8F069|nr:rhomboid family intramembrane serine protease [Butyrivibrio sp. CB08]RKM56120.1 rhomboid family intramembrane serine protease [Butyrivibrio sp. CB08]